MRDTRVLQRRPGLAQAGDGMREIKGQRGGRPGQSRARAPVRETLNVRSVGAARRGGRKGSGERPPSPGFSSSRYFIAETVRRTEALKYEYLQTHQLASTTGSVSPLSRGQQ